MARTVNVNFRLDEEVKKSMEQACAEMGLTMSAAFTVFAKKVGREKRIPFEINAEPSCPNKETIAAMLEAERIAKDPSIKGYTDLDELFADLKT